MNEESDDIAKATAKVFLKLLGISAMVVILSMVLLFQFCHCETETKQKVQVEQPDTIRPQIQVNKADIKTFADSIPILKAQLLAATNRKNYYKQKYRSVYDSVYSASDSVCKSYLGLVNRIKQKQDSAHEAENEANSQLIINAFNQIGEYQDNEILYEAKIKQDSTDKSEAKIESEKTAKAEFKRGKKVGRKQGFISGLILSGAVYVGSVVKP